MHQKTYTRSRFSFPFHRKMYIRPLVRSHFYPNWSLLFALNLTYYVLSGISENLNVACKLFAVRLLTTKRCRCILYEPVYQVASSYAHLSIFMGVLSRLCYCCFAIASPSWNYWCERTPDLHQILFEKKLRALSPRANYTDLATAACLLSYCQLLRIEGVAWSAQLIPAAIFSVF
jgi:hypothetical protein